MPEARRREILLVAGALLLRLGWMWEMSRLPFFDLPTSDSLFYAQQAARIAQGHLIGTELSYPSSPLYPYIIAPLFLLGGKTAFAGVYLLQALLDALSVVLVARIAGSIFGRRAAWIAGAAWAGYGLAVFFTADLMEATAAAALANLSLYLLVASTAEGSASRWFGSGASLAAAALLRPQIIPLLPLAAAGAALLVARARRARAAIIFTAGVSLLLGLSLARNLAVSGEMVLVSPYSGLNAYLGNHRGARGYLSFPPGRGLRNDVDLKEAAHAYPEAIEGRPLRESEVSAFWWRETAREIAADPAGFAALALRKLALFWSSYEAPNHLDFEFFRATSLSLSLAAIPFGLIAPLSLTGVALTFTRAWRDRRILLVSLLAVAYGLSCALFFIADRFRLPVTGWLVVLAAGALTEILERASARRHVAALAPAALALLLGFALHAPPPAATGSREHVMVAAALAGRGRVDEAERLLRRAVAIDPGSAVARYNLGRLLIANGRAEEGGAALLEAARLSPDFSAAQAALGDLAMRAGTPAGNEEARRRYEAALAIEPYGREAARIRQAIAALDAKAPASPGARR
jgi:tetratricopeptide (TPR) repeat protein